MQHDHVLKKLNFDQSPGSGVWGGGGGGGGSAGNHVAAFVILFNLYATRPCSEKVEFRPTDPISRVGGGVCGQNICYDVAAFLILFHLICNMTMF